MTTTETRGHGITAEEAAAVHTDPAHPGYVERITRPPMVWHRMPLHGDVARCGWISPRTDTPGDPNMPAGGPDDIPVTCPGCLAPGPMPATRAGRKAWRGELAAWLRAAGIVPDGDAWRVATVDGVRELDQLRGLNARDGLAARRLPDGEPLPGGCRAGDFLPDVCPGGVMLTASPVVDPDTGRVWVTGTDPAGTRVDIDLDPVTPVTRTRTRTAPEWVRAASDDYRAARASWEEARESGRIVPTSVPGTAGSAAAMYQLTDAEYREHVPAPRFAEYLTEHAARRRDPATA